MAMKIVSPWVNLYREYEEFFRRDPYVKVLCDDEHKTIDLYVDGDAKAEALAMMMPAERTFGSVVVKICIIPSNDKTKTCGDLCVDAFSSNEALAFTKTIHGLFNNDITYVVFENTVVQYHNDDLGDIFGQRSCLYQDLAKDIFTEADGVYFCTNKNTYKGPAGYWP